MIEYDPILTETFAPLEQLGYTKMPNGGYRLFAHENKGKDMTDSIEQTLQERGNRYGEFKSHAWITQGIKHTMQASPKWLDLQDDQMEALDMIAHKIGRILNGDPDYIDSWHDIIGYARLVEQRLIKEQAIPRATMNTTLDPKEE